MSIPAEVLERKAQELKEQIGAAVDGYVAHYKQAQIDKSLKIDQVEEYLIELKAQANRLFHETTTEMLSAIESDLIEKKKLAPIAEKG
jgi:hypothetical protein